MDGIETTQTPFSTVVLRRLGFAKCCQKLERNRTGSDCLALGANRRQSLVKRAAIEVKRVHTVINNN